MCEKSRPLPGFNFRTVQSVASPYTHWAIPAHGGYWKPLFALRSINRKERGNIQIWRYCSGNVICVSWFWFYIVNCFIVGFVNPPKQSAKYRQLDRPVSELMCNDFWSLKTKIKPVFCRSVSPFYETHYECPLYRRIRLTLDHAALRCFYCVGALNLLQLELFF